MKPWILGFSLGLWMLFSGCATTNWWDEPPLMDGKITAVGQAININPVTAKNAAETNAKYRLASFVKTQIQGLTETWGKQAGSDKVVSKVSSYFNDENIIRNLTNTTLRGARPVKYKVHGKYQYVLMVLDTEAFAKYWKKVGSQAFEDQTLLQSQAMKEDYANRMDKLIGDYLKRVKGGLQAK